MTTPPPYMRAWINEQRALKKKRSTWFMWGCILSLSFGMLLGCWLVWHLSTIGVIVPTREQEKRFIAAMEARIDARQMAYTCEVCHK